jgi:hypothetical protein
MQLAALKYAVVVLPLLLAAVGCGGFGGEHSASGGTASLDGGGAASVDGPDGGAAAVDASTSDPASGGGDAAAPSPARIDVHGTVSSFYDNATVASRPVRVRGADGKNVDVMTDATGAFTAPGVLTPYDVRVSPEGLTDYATVYLRLRDSAVHLTGFRTTPNPANVTQTFNMGVLLPSNCATCQVTFASKSAHGRGATTVAFGSGSTTATGAVAHSFVSDGSPSEAVTMDILVHDVPATWFRYQQVSLTAVAGRTSPGGLFAPPLVPVYSVTTTLQTAAVPANWTPQMSLSLHLASGNDVQLLTAGALTATTVLPDISGAGPWAYAWAVDPVNNSDATVTRDSQARSGYLSGATGSIALSASAPLQDVVPAPHGTSSVAGPGISWAPAPSTVTSTYIVDASNRGAYVITEGSQIAWADLASLGIQVAPGAYSMSFITTPDTTLASYVAVDPAVRKTFSFDNAVAASNSYARWPFTLTP